MWSDTARALTAPDADVAALVERLNALREKRTEILARPQVPTLSQIATGRTFEEEWHACEDLASHRDLLASAIYAVEVAPAEGRRVDAGEDLVDHS